MPLKRIEAVFLALGLFAAAAPATCGADEPQAAAACAACHGPAGEGNAATATPRLAGLPLAYLEAELDRFADGTRQSPVMAPLARSLGATERKALARYYAALAPRAAAPARAPAGLDDQLALHGRWSQQLPACVQCHGANGSGIGAAFPPLSGQPPAYISAQLRAWKDGTRSGDPLGLMQKVATGLSDSDMRSVADYFGAIPAGGVAPEPGAARREESGLPSAAAASPRAAFTPSELPIPDDDFGKVIQLGRSIFDDPEKYAGRYVGNDLRCTSCHLDEGRRVGSAPMWAAYVSYPAYRAKNGHVNTFAERLQGCFLYSMNGRAPPLGDSVLVALESYSYWMARGAPLDPHIAGRGYPKLAVPAKPRDAGRGSEVYSRQCALCHGDKGAGQRARDGSPGFPALWGADSYNWGAGMVNVSNAAAFIKVNMPFSMGGTLTDQEAWDVAVFIDGHDRPQDPRYTGSVAATRSRFHDQDDSLYGTMVDGQLLGSSSVPPGRHAPAPHSAQSAR